MSIKRTNARYLIYIIASSSLFSPSFSSAHKARTLSLDCNRFVSPSRHPVSLTPACRVRVWICLQSALPHSRPIESVFVFSSFGSNADAAIVSTVFFSLSLSVAQSAGLPCAAVPAEIDAGTATFHFDVGRKCSPQRRLFPFLRVRQSGCR